MIFQEALAAVISREESFAALQSGASPPHSANGTSSGQRSQEMMELSDQVEALLDQLSAEADLGSASLDRAEAAEAEAAQLRFHLQQQVCDISPPPFQCVCIKYDVITLVVHSCWLGPVALPPLGCCDKSDGL